MVYIHPDVTKAAIVCDLSYNSLTGEGQVQQKDGTIVPKETKVYCTTVEEFTIVKHLGYKAGFNPHPSDATMNGVEISGVDPIGEPGEIITQGVPPIAPVVE